MPTQDSLLQRSFLVERSLIPDYFFSFSSSDYIYRLQIITKNAATATGATGAGTGLPLHPRRPRRRSARAQCAGSRPRVQRRQQRRPAAPHDLPGHLRRRPPSRAASACASGARGASAASGALCRGHAATVSRRRLAKDSLPHRVLLLHGTPRRGIAAAADPSRCLLGHCVSALVVRLPAALFTVQKLCPR